MEHALASAPGPDVTEHSGNSDTRFDTKTPPASSATASFFPANNSSPSSPVSALPPQFKQNLQSRSQSQSHSPPPISIPAHARSSTVDGFPGSSSVSGSIASPSGSVNSPLGGPIKRKPLSSSASALALRYSASGSSPPSPLDLQLEKPSQRFARPDSVDSPTLYEFSPSSRAVPPATQ